MNQIENLLQSLSKKKNKKIVENLLSSSQCHICHELINVPMMLTCGHNYCYMCLKNWFKTNETRKLGCPDCRKVVEVIPVFNTFLDNQLKFVLDLLTKDNGSKNSKWVQLLSERQEDETIYKNDIVKDIIFANVFKNSTLAVIDMDDDGIPRCGNCHWELDPDDMDSDEEDNVCPHCHYRIRNNVVNGGNSENVMSNSARNITNNLRRHEDEYSEGEYEEIIEEIRRFSDSDLEDNSEEEEDKKSNKTNDSGKRQRRGEETQEIYDYEAIDENSDNGDEEEDEKEDSDDEHDSDLDSFIESDEEISDDGKSKSRRKRKHSKLFYDEDAEDNRREDSNDSNSDFYEHNDGDGFVSGDSLDDNELNSGDQIPSSDNEEFISSRKRLRKAQVMTSDEE